MALLLALLSAVSVLLIVVGLARQAAPSGSSLATRLERYASWQRQRAAPAPGGGPAGLRAGTRAAQERIDRALGGSSYAMRVQRELSKANLRLTVAEYLMFQVASVVLCLVIGLIVFRQPLLGVLCGLGGYVLPGIYVKLKQRSRLNQFNSQLGDALVMLANSLRAGYSLAQSMDLVAREGRPPLSEEFQRVNREIALGLSPEEALANLVRRIDSDDLDLVVTAINVQREVGGNLAEILDTIAHTIRERVKLKGDIKALTAQAEYSAYVVAFLPVALAVILWLINRQYMMRLVEDICGWSILACSAILIVAGFFAMRKVAQVEV